MNFLCGRLEEIPCISMRCVGNRQQRSVVLIVRLSKRYWAPITGDHSPHSLPPCLKSPRLSIPVFPSQSFKVSQNLLRQCRGRQHSFGRNDWLFVPMHAILLVYSSFKKRLWNIYLRARHSAGIWCISFRHSTRRFLIKQAANVPGLQN